MFRLTNSSEPLTLADLQTALATAGEEDARWEAKGPGVGRKDIVKAVAGMANRDGGVVVLGADGGGTSWAVEGLELPRDGEPGRWIADLIGNGLKPVPRVETRVVTIDATSGRWAAVLKVEPLERDLTVYVDGRVFLRDHGRTTSVQDGASLTNLVLRRAGVGLPARLDASMAADDLSVEVGRAARAGDLAGIRSLLSRLRTDAIRAIQFGPEPERQGAVARLTLSAAALADATDAPAPLMASIRELHVLFDGVRRLEGPANARYDLELFRTLRPNVLALGGLLIRLERWEAARALAAHPGPEIGRARRSWLVYMAVTQTRASPADNAEAQRHAIRAGREATTRHPALRPDHADEHTALASIIGFDVVGNLVELDRAAREGYEGEVWPDAALFNASGTHPTVERLLTDATVRDAVAPANTEEQVARLLVAFDNAAYNTMPASGVWGGSFTSEARGILRSLGVVGK